MLEDALHGAQEGVEHLAGWIKLIRTGNTAKNAITRFARILDTALLPNLGGAPRRAHQAPAATPGTSVCEVSQDLGRNSSQGLSRPSKKTRPKVDESL